MCVCGYSGLHCVSWDFSNCGKQGLLFFATHGLLIAVTSVEQRGGYSTQALVAVGEGLSCFALWDLRRPGIEPVFPALQGELLTTGLPGKLQIFFF